MKHIVRALALISALTIQTSFAAKTPLSITFEKTSTQANLEFIKKALEKKEQSLRAFFATGYDEIFDSAAGPYFEKYKELSDDFFLTSEDVSGAQKYVVVLWGLNPVNVLVLTDQKTFKLTYDIMQHFLKNMVFASYAYQSLEASIKADATVYASFVYVFPDGSIKIDESRGDIESVSSEMVDGYTDVKPEVSNGCLLL